MAANENSAGATMSFFRHGEDYRPDGAKRAPRRDSKTKSGSQAAPQTIGFDESPTGYSSASCSPAVLASASPGYLGVLLAGVGEIAVCQLIGRGTARPRKQSIITLDEYIPVAGGNLLQLKS
ncbi:MAG TPA: hypothetical protein VJ023_02700 [Pyrinomonadaceae bacterium]|nr:hypothetical protein [Pyrinomonadaceae bacterium]